MFGLKLIWYKICMLNSFLFHHAVGHGIIFLGFYVFWYSRSLYSVYQYHGTLLKKDLENRYKNTLYTHFQLTDNFDFTPRNALDFYEIRVYNHSYSQWAKNIITRFNNYYYRAALKKKYLIIVCYTKIKNAYNPYLQFIFSKYNINFIWKNY